MTGSMKQSMAQGHKPLGVLVRMPAEELVEMAGVAGMDFVLIDAEHGPADLIPLRAHITIAQLHGMSVLVRVGQDEPALVQRVLDHGADGIVIPHVEDADGARRAVAAARYAPIGARGFATYGRTGRFGTVGAREHLDRDVARTMVFPMIESETACRNADEIASVAGVDGVMVGPADLAMDMGESSAAEPRVRAAVDRAVEAVARQGRHRLRIVADGDAAATAFESGVEIVVVNLSHALMAMLAGIRSAGPGSRT